MPKAKRAILRLALVGWLGLTGLTGPGANLARAAAPPEQVLPDSTIFFLKIADAVKFREAFRQSQYGQLWNDPALGIAWPVTDEQAVLSDRDRSWPTFAEFRTAA